MLNVNKTFKSENYLNYKALIVKIPVKVSSYE